MRHAGELAERFPAFAEIVRGDDGPAKRAVVAALLDEVELTPEGLSRDRSVGLDFPEGVAAAVLRMRQFETDLSAPKRGPQRKPRDIAADPLPETENET